MATSIPTFKLEISEGMIDFSKDKTNYSLEVDSNIEKINISINQ